MGRGGFKPQGLDNRSGEGEERHWSAPVPTADPHVPAAARSATSSPASNSGGSPLAPALDALGRRRRRRSSLSEASPLVRLHLERGIEPAWRRDRAPASGPATGEERSQPGSRYMQALAGASDVVVSSVFVADGLTAKGKQGTPESPGNPCANSVFSAGRPCR